MSEKKTILFVDDEPTIRRIAQLVESPSLHVITAEDGLDAYQKCLEHSPDIVFSDSIMPKYDGGELCQMIKSNHATKDTPFVLLTNHDQHQLPHHFSKANIDDTLQKPFSATDLSFKIKTWTSPSSATPIESSSLPVFTDYRFGNASLDQQLPDGILPKSCIAHIRNHPVTPFLLSNQFISQALSTNGRCVTLSFEPPEQTFHSTLIKDTSLHTVLNATSWCQPTDSPWRNLDFIFDALFQQCQLDPTSHLLIESFSIGFPFWTIPETLKFLQLCRSLPHQPCILISMAYTPHFSNHIQTINQVMDIVIETNTSDGDFNHMITQSKWQPIG